MATKHLSGLQYLRFIAASLVVLFHANGAYLSLYDTQKTNYLSFGATGVQLFFVISGFVIYFSYSKRPIPVSEFAINRVSRIAPSYITLTVAAMIMLLLTHQTGNSAVSASALVPWFLSSLSFTSQIFGFPSPLLYQGWSLEYEMFFYLVFTVGIAAFKGRQRLIALSSTFVIVSACFIPGFALSAVGFALGVGVAMLREKARPSRVASLAIFLSSAACLFALFMTTDWTKNPLLVTSSYAVIVYAISNLSVAAPGLGEALGSASYPVYLLQWFTIPAIEKSWHFIHIDNSPIANALFLVAALMATLTLGVAWDRFADRPISKATKTFLRGLKLRN